MDLVMPIAWNSKFVKLMFQEAERLFDRVFLACLVASLFSIICVSTEIP